jgi:hypothetical protein
MHPLSGTLFVCAGLVAFDSEISELQKWTFIVETSKGCFYVPLKTVNKLSDQIEFILQPLNLRRVVKATKLYIFNAKGILFASRDFDIWLFYNYQLLLTYNIIP